jgi:hypothetical protein
VRRDQEDGGTTGGSLSLEATAFGGHSLLSFASSLTDSPVDWDRIFVLRGDPERDWRLVCCSNRPMRFATLCRGRSSGSGLMGIMRLEQPQGEDGRTCCYGWTEKGKN